MSSSAAPPNMRRQETLAIFVESIMHYFESVTGEPAETETPYLHEGSMEMLDVTAVIGVTGDLLGCVYYTAPFALLDTLLRCSGETDITDDLRCDMAGEAANTLSGNARRKLGPGFMISVPVVLQGKPDRVKRPKGSACFTIPILWKGTRSLLMICLVENLAANSL